MPNSRRIEEEEKRRNAVYKQSTKFLFGYVISNIFLFSKYTLVNPGIKILPLPSANSLLG
jgi:hypothetical protein